MDMDMRGTTSESASYQHPMATDDGILHSTKLQCRRVSRRKAGYIRRYFSNQAVAGGSDPTF